MFKADYPTALINYTYWHPTTTKLMRFMLTATLFMLMLTCGFGVAVTPMIWGVIGLIAKSTSLHHHARSLMWMISLVPVHATIPPKTQHTVHDTINAVVVPDGLSVKKECTRAKSRNSRHLNRLPHGHHSLQRRRHKK